MTKGNPIDVEQVFDSFVRKFGGTVLKEELAGDPGFENADYIFHEHHFVAELKCLQDNKLEDPVYMSKIDTAWQKWRKNELVTGDTPEEIFLEGLPLQCQRELIAIGENSLKAVVKKANRQIKATKEALSIPSYKGLLLLANDGNFGLSPNTLCWLIEKLLEHEYASIDNAVIFTVNMEANVTGVRIPCRIWMPFGRVQPEAADFEFLSALGDGWSVFLDNYLGKSSIKFGDTEGTPL